MKAKPGGRKTKRGRPSKAMVPMVTPETALWCAVIEVAIADSLAAGRSSRLDAISARAFLLGPSRSRDTILGVLGIDIGWFCDVILPPLRNAWRKLDDGIVGKRRGQRRNLAVQARGLKPDAIAA